MTLEKGSLILVDYTAKVKDTNEVFETTFEEEAKKSNNYDPTHKYEPRLVSVGEGWVLRGVDEALAAANAGDKMSIEVTPDKGFGERDPSKVRMVPQRKLGEKADEIGVGDMVEMDDRTGIVRHIGSGRVQIDFNHRFAGRTLTYDLNIVKKLEDESEKVMALLRRRIPINKDQIMTNISADTLDIQLPEETFLAEGLQIIKRAVVNDIFKFIPNIKKIKFIEEYKRQDSQAEAQKEQPATDKQKDKEAEEEGKVKETESKVA